MAFNPPSSTELFQAYTTFMLPTLTDELLELRCSFWGVLKETNYLVSSSKRCQQSRENSCWLYTDLTDALRNVWSKRMDIDQEFSPLLLSMHLPSHQHHHKLVREDNWHPTSAGTEAFKYFFGQSFSSYTSVTLLNEPEEFFRYSLVGLDLSDAYC